MNEPETWQASIALMRYVVEGATHTSVQVKINDASSQQVALDAATEIMDRLAGDRRTVVRNAPEAQSMRDFETDAIRHGGYARFTFIDEPGERTILESEVPIGLGWPSTHGKQS